METENLKKELAVIEEQSCKALVAAEELKIKDKDGLVFATELLGKIKTVGKLILGKKEAITKPLNEALRQVRAQFSPIEDQYEKAERMVKWKMIEFNKEELAKAAKKTAVIEKKVEAGKMTFEKAAEKIEAATPQKEIKTEVGGVQFRTKREVVIEDETKVPREYFVLDMVKIRRVALAGVEIPGVKIVVEQTVAGTR